MADRTLNHFAFFSYRDAYQELPAAERAAFAQAWLSDLRSAAERVEVLQVFPSRADADLLVWSALPLDDAGGPAQFFQCFARAVNAHRHLLQATLTLWGFTKPSQYARGGSAQEVDPFAPQRQPYLVLYPFVKTADWYLMSRDTRQGMMNEHIRVGHQFPEIKQLLLYSFGLQDQEFIVVYETADLVQFSDLVNQLRDTEARKYTERDTPVYTAVYHPAEETLALWS